LEENDKVLKLDIFEQGDEKIEFLNGRNWIKGMANGVSG